MRESVTENITKFTETPIEDMDDSFHKKEYENIMKEEGLSGTYPEWDDLDEKEKQIIREENYRYASQMRSLRDLVEMSGLDFDKVMEETEKRSQQSFNDSSD